MAQWCFCYSAAKSHALTADKAVVLRETKWPPGSAVRIAFLGGDGAVQSRVREAAVLWTLRGGGPANLQFDFVPDPKTADIRVAFEPGGSWSVLGTTCKHIRDPAAPTMNFGWLKSDTPDADLRRVVLHEFGHAIGLIHEHLSPKVNVKWNKDRVYADLGGPPNEWDRATVDTNMFNVFEERRVDATDFDPQSIMLYVIPPHWTTDGFFTVLNTELSASDRAHVARAYPPVR